MTDRKETPRERQAREFQQIVPCVNCGHPTSPLGDHDCEKWLQTIEPKRAYADDTVVGPGSLAGLMNSAYASSAGVAGHPKDAKLAALARDVARLEAEKAELARALGRLHPAGGPHTSQPEPDPEAARKGILDKLLRPKRPPPECEHLYVFGQAHCVKCGHYNSGEP